jgi:hypothetical protein
MGGFGQLRLAGVEGTGSHGTRLGRSLATPARRSCGEPHLVGRSLRGGRAYVRITARSEHASPMGPVTMSRVCAPEEG